MLFERYSSWDVMYIIDYSSTTLNLETTPTTKEILQSDEDQGVGITGEIRVNFALMSDEVQAAVQEKTSE